MGRSEVILLNNLRTEFRQCANEKDARVLRQFFKTAPGQYGEGDIFLGIRVPVIRKFVKHYYEQISLRETRCLLNSKFHEERLLGVLILVAKFQKGDDELQRLVYEMYLSCSPRVNNWDLVDLSAGQIVGAYLFARDRSPLHALAESDLLWDRRIAIVSTFYFIRKNEFEDTMDISLKLLHDDHDLIHKAVGWMLREVGKRDQLCEEHFLRKHYRTMPRTMLRYAIERFPEALRQDYLKGRIGAGS